MKNSQRQGVNVKDNCFQMCKTPVKEIVIKMSHQNDE